MLGIVCHILFTVFTLYVLIESIVYANFEIKNQKNKFGGIAVIAFTAFCIIFSNILVWMN